MLICIADVLSKNEIMQIQQQMQAHMKTMNSQSAFVNGKHTAGWHAKLVKNNLQLGQVQAPKLLEKLQKIVLMAVQRNALFQMAVRPKKIHPPLVSRYDVGMNYGTHVDNAIMGSGEAVLRSDVSFTLFLNDTSDYEGGELVMESTQGEQSFKLEAGCMVVYPSSTLHRVEPVQQGQRLVAVSWVQSLVPQVHHRKILFDLDTARQTLFQQHGKTPEFDAISKVLSNLICEWAQV